MKTTRPIRWRKSLITFGVLMFQAIACGEGRFSSCDDADSCGEQLGESDTGEGGSAGEHPDASGGQAGAVAAQSGGASGTTTSGGSGGSGGVSATSASSVGGSSGAAGESNLPPCPAGFERDEQAECADIDECEVNHGGCDTDAECHESEIPAEEPTCTCPEGFLGDGFECELEVVDVSVNHDQACAIRFDRSLACWGRNSHGQLGPEAVGSALAWPTLVGGEDLEWDSVSVGASHICGISNGKAYCWGANADGALGQGEPGVGSDLTEPAQVGGYDDWTKIVAGDNATCGIRSNERLYCWGLVFGSEDDEEFVSDPVEVGVGPGWSDVALALDHACGIRDGQIYCFGRNTFNTLGIDVDRVLEPTLVDDANDWMMLSAHDYYTCAINWSHDLYCWGNWGPTSNAIGLEQVSAGIGWETISLGESAGCGIRSGELACWGDSARGLRGAGEPDENQVTPTQFGPDWEKVAVGYEYACALRAGRLYCWGHNANGRLGVGDDFPTSIATPQRVGDSTLWTTVSAGQDVTCGLQGGEAHCWGAQLNGSLRYGALPRQFGVEHDWTSISAGSLTITGVRSGDLFWWGHPPNEVATSGMTHDPMQDGLGHSWQQVHTSSADNGPTCGIGSPGDSLFCYGPINDDGQLGLGNREEPDEPMQVGTSSSWEVVAPGFAGSCGIDSGRLFCWGNNYYGQLGLGDDLLGEEQLSPVQVGSEDDWSDVAVSGAAVTCGIRRGELNCWGRDTYIRPALGLIGNASTPVRVGELANWVQVTLGARHGCGLLEDGALYCWGDNTQSLLGLETNGEPALVSEPTLVDGGSNWVQVSASYYHTCGLQGDGSVWCWGGNESGQLGVGPSWSNTPVPVSMD